MNRKLQARRKNTKSEVCIRIGGHIKFFEDSLQILLVSDPIHDLFQLILIDHPNLSPDVIDKNP